MGIAALVLIRKRQREGIALAGLGCPDFKLIRTSGGVGQATIYAPKAKFGGMDASESQRLRLLEGESSRLKHL
jgi:putative transposase